VDDAGLLREEMRRVFLDLEAVVARALSRGVSREEIVKEGKRAMEEYGEKQDG
jgi:hypothetical protein